MQVCGTTPCRLNGAQNVAEALSEYLGIGIGQTTADGTFTLGEMECMGACVNAPMIVVSDYSNGVEGYSYIYYEDLTPDDAVSVAKAYAAGAPRPQHHSPITALPRMRLRGTSGCCCCQRLHVRHSMAFCGCRGRHPQAAFSFSSLTLDAHIRPVHLLAGNAPCEGCGPRSWRLRSSV